MPELPEVEAARRALHESCCGRCVVQAIVAEDPIVIDGVSSSALETALTGRTILAAFRKGKNIWLQLDAPPWPSFQFGMTGAFYIKGKEITKYKRSAVSDKEEWPSKFSKVFLKLDGGLEVSFTDKRRLARVRLLDDPAAAPPISELGPDALLELPTEAVLASRILKKKCPIKALLLDQSFVAGIGNWVADEVLYQARIHPEQVASSLSEADCAKLRKTIEEVVRFAVEVDADSERFPKNWIFHYRWNKKPGEVDGHKIAFITVGGRTSAIVPTLQKCTAHSSQKQKRLAEEQVDEDGKLKNGTRDGKKNGRKNQASKKAVSEAAAGESSGDSDAEPGTSDGKKKGRKSQPAKRAVSEEATEEGSDDPDAEPVKRKSRGSRSLAKKAGPRLRGKGARPPQGVQGTGIESNSALKDQKPDRFSQARRTAKSPAAAVTTALDVAAKLGTKRGKATTKQQEAVEVQTDDTDKHTMMATNQKDKVSNTGHSQRGIKSSRKSLEREKPIVDEVVEGSTISKKAQGQKRRRVAK